MEIKTMRTHLNLPTDTTMRWALFLLLAAFGNAQSDDTVSLSLFHRLVSPTALQQNSAPSFSRRAQLEAEVVDGGKATYSPFLDPIPKVTSKAEELLYQIAIGEEEPKKILTFPLCTISMAEGQGLSDALQIFYSSSGEFVSFGYFTNSHSCQSSNTTSIPTELFRDTKVTVSRGGQAPEPILKQPPKVVVDESGKMKKEEPEKSFIAKYWMFLLPIAVILLTSGPASPPEGGNSRR